MLPKSYMKDWHFWLQLFSKNWLIISICLLLAIALGLTLAFTIEPEFESTTQIMILDTDLLSGSNLRFVPNLPQRQEIDYLRRLIQSTAFMSNLIDSLKIAQKPKLRAEIMQLSLEYPHISPHEIALQVYIKYLQKKINTRSTEYNIIEIRARGKTPEEAYITCKLVTDMAINETRDKQMQSVFAASSLSHELLQTYRKRLMDAEERLNQFNRGDLDMEDNINELDNTKLSEIKSIILSTRIEQKAKEEERNELNALLRHVSPIQNKYNDPDVEELKNKLLSRTRNVCQLFKQFSWKDIEVIQINEEIGQIKQNLFERLQRNIINSASNLSPDTIQRLTDREKLNVELAVLQETSNTLSGIVASHNNSKRLQPSRDAMKERLIREVQTSREIYEMLLQQIQGTKIRESAQIKEAKMRYQVIAPPKRPLERTKPNRRRIMMISLFLGSVMSVAIVVGKESIDLSIKYLEQVNQILKIPVLATIPRINTNTNSKAKKFFKELAFIIIPVITLSVLILALSHLL